MKGGEVVKNGITLESLENRFTYHAPKEGQPLLYETIRNTGKNLAVMLYQICPEGPELTEAIKKIDEAVMWANAAIARHQ